MTKYEKYKLIIGASFSFLFFLLLFNYSSNGRYIIREESFVILDTKKRTLYIPHNKKYVKIDGFTEMEKNNENE